jgi:hypothetical protein
VPSVRARHGRQRDVRSPRGRLCVGRRARRSGLRSSAMGEPSSRAVFASSSSGSSRWFQAGAPSGQTAY